MAEMTPLLFFFANPHDPWEMRIGAAELISFIAEIPVSRYAGRC